MTYLLGLVLLLVVIAGIIAFLGDRLGTIVGRRRLTVFGARPRRSGQIVGVVAGIVIMLTTLGVLALAFQNATQTIVNAQRTADELVRLRAQERVQQDKVNGLNKQLTSLKDELAKAQQTIASAQTQRDAALKERDQARQERDSLQAQRGQLQAQVDQLSKSVAAVNTQLADAQGKLTQAQTALQAAQTAQSAAVKARDQAQTDATQARQDASKLQGEVQAARKELDDANQRLDALQAKLADTEKRLASADAQLTAAQAGLKQAQDAQAQAETAREQAQQQATAFQQQTQQLSGQIGQLQDEVAGLQQQQAQLQGQASALRQDNQGLQARNDTLSKENARFVQQNQVLSDQKDQLQQQITAQNQSVKELQGQLQTLSSRLEEQARKLNDVSAEYNRATSGDVTFQKDELIYAGAIYAQDPAAIKDELTKFIAAATTYVARRGVEKLRVTPEQFNSLVDVIAQTPGSDLVRLISPRNQFSSTVDVSVEAIENTKLFDKGQLVVSRQIHLGSVDLPASQDEIRNDLTQLKGDAVRKLRRAGLDEMQVPDFGAVTDDVFTSLLLRLHGPVTIGLVASQDIYRAGPAKLEMMVLY